VPGWSSLASSGGRLGRLTDKRHIETTPRSRSDRPTERGATDPESMIGRSDGRYCLSNTMTLSEFSPFAVVILDFAVSVLPSLDTVRLVVQKRKFAGTTLTGIFAQRGL
jgi:hypothetical protein